MNNYFMYEITYEQAQIINYMLQRKDLIYTAPYDILGILTIDNILRYIIEAPYVLDRQEITLTELGKQCSIYNENNKHYLYIPIEI